MPFRKGKSGNPGGRPKQKPFAEALRMELAKVGKDHKALRRIARNLIRLANEESRHALPAIKEIADRLDGRPLSGVEEATDETIDALAELMRSIAANKVGLIRPEE